jgi:O-6-methylguanine DNA methyltransferase
MAQDENRGAGSLDGGRFRVLGATRWRNRLRAVLGDRQVAWSARRVEGWGELFLAATRDGLCRVALGGFADVEADLSSAFGSDEPPESVRRDDELLGPFVELIADFLAHPESVEVDLPVDAIGTAFQRAVWDALTRIGSGESRSYKDVAVEIGRPGSSRAVGGACGANPVPLVVPCHRVIGSSGKLTGFGLGVAVKERLLDAESGIRGLPLG